MLSRHLVSGLRSWSRLQQARISSSPLWCSMPETKEKTKVHGVGALHVSRNPSTEPKTLGRNLEDLSSFYRGLNYRAIAFKYRDKALDQAHRAYGDLMYIKKAPLPAVGLASAAALPVLLPLFVTGVNAAEIQTIYVSWLMTLAGGTAMGSALQGHPLVTNRNPLVQSAVPPALGLACMMVFPTSLSLLSLIGGLGWVASLDTVYDTNIHWLRALKLAFCLATALCLFVSLLHAFYVRLAGGSRRAPVETIPEP